MGRSTEKGQNPVPSAICGEGLEKSKQHHKKPPPRYLGPGKSNERPDSQTLELAGGRIIMHAIYRGQSRRVNERAWVGGQDTEIAVHRERERELSVVLNRFQNLLLKSIISRGWCMCGVQAAASSSVRTHRTLVGASSGKENMPILNRSSDNLGKVLLSA